MREARRPHVPGPGRLPPRAPSGRAARTRPIWAMLASPAGGWSPLVGAWLERRPKPRSRRGLECRPRSPGLPISRAPGGEPARSRGLASAGVRVVRASPADPQRSVLAVRTPRGRGTEPFLSAPMQAFGHDPPGSPEAWCRRGLAGPSGPGAKRWVRNATARSTARCPPGTDRRSPRGPPVVPFRGLANARS